MAQWKKVIVSGSSAELASLKVDGTISGSIFSGSFVGNGSGLTGISAAPTYQIKGNDNTSATFDPANNTLLFSTASIHGFGFTVDGSTEKRVRIVTPQDLRTTGTPTFQDLTVSNKLTVLGSITELQIDNVNVEDKFIYINSGSSGGDSGIVFGGSTLGQGVGFGWESTAARFGIQQATQIVSSATSITPEAFVPVVVDIAAGQSATSEFTKNGNLRIESNGDIFIYS